MYVVDIDDFYNVMLPNDVSVLFYDTDSIEKKKQLSRFWKFKSELAL